MVRVPAPPEAVDRLDRSAQLLLEKNQVMNLTAITEPEQVARLHMLDCAALLGLAVHGFHGQKDAAGLEIGQAQLRQHRQGGHGPGGLLNVCPLEGRRLLDVGTGAGFPGMVLKILVPSLVVL